MQPNKRDKSKLLKAIKCPFCNGKDVWVDGTYYASIIRCQNIKCRASGPVKKSPYSAVEAWNERKGL